MGKTKGARRNRSRARGRPAAQPAPGTMGKATSAKRDGQAARRAFECLLFDEDAKEHLANLRSATGFGSRHDHCEVRVWIPTVRDGEATQDVEDLYARQLTGPGGMIEDLVLRVDMLCDQIDPAGALDGESTDNRAPGGETEPESAEAEEHRPLSPAEGAPAVEADTAKPSEKADDAGREYGDDAPEGSVTAAAGDETEKRRGLPSLRELVGDLPLDCDPMTRGIVAMPKSELVVQAFLVQFRRVLRRLEGLRQFVDELPVPDEAGLDYGGSAAEKEAAKLELGELDELLVDLREDTFVYLNHTGTGRLVELDDLALAAVHKLARSVPRYRWRTGLIVNAAVQCLATLPNRDGLLADAEQRRLQAWDEECHRKPRHESSGWPWADKAGRPLTAESEYESTGEATVTPVPAESAADTPAVEPSAVPTGPADGTAISEPAGAAIDEGGDEADAEFAQLIMKSAARDFTGTAVAPLLLELYLPGGHSLLDVPLLVLPENRLELVAELRAIAVRWAERYGAAVKQGFVG